MNRLLWVFQALLALLFLFAGGSKLVMPAAQLTAQTPLPAVLLRGVGVLEILGALGLILPGMLRIRTELTAIAAAGLTVIMICAVVITMRSMGVTMAIMPAVTGVLTAFVAWKRWPAAKPGI